MKTFTKTEKAVWLAQLNIANQVLHSALSLAGESVPSEAREKLHLALESIAESERIVRFTKV